VGALKLVILAVAFVVAATLAHAEDMAQMISQYRQEHGLSAVKTDLQLTAIAERQANAMAASGIMDHNVAGSFASRVSGAHLGMTGENIAAGTKTWAETFHVWQNSPGHNANLLQAQADSITPAPESARNGLPWLLPVRHDLARFGTVLRRCGLHLRRECLVRQSQIAGVSIETKGRETCRLWRVCSLAQSTK
jgi:hypothetical protein